LARPPIAARKTKYARGHRAAKGRLVGRPRPRRCAPTTGVGAGPELTDYSEWTDWSR
jgi:hypothetical protein